MARPKKIPSRWSLTSIGKPAAITAPFTDSHLLWAAQSFPAKLSPLLSGLAPNTLYHYRVKSRDAAGNLATSADFTFTTAAAPDTTAPVISGVGSSNITASGASVAWTTNEASDTQVEYGLTTGYGSSTTLNPAMVTSHSASLSGLAANTLYHYRVKSRDAAGNLRTATSWQ